jgi:DNA-binding LytR/AlgR family response regulator
MKAKILIIEDDILSLESIASTLKSENYSITKASSPEDAFSTFLNNVHDLVLMDIDLKSDMDGIELAAKMHKHRPDIPIIYLTDKKDPRVIERARNIHHAYYMTKPFEDAILLSQVELALSQTNNSDKETGLKSLFIKLRATDTHKTAVPFERIYYLQAQRAYCHLYYLPEDKQSLEKLELSMDMGSILSKLPSDLFLQVHRSYCVNVQQIHAYDNKDVLVKGQAIPVSKRYQSKLSEYIKQA